MRALALVPLFAIVLATPALAQLPEDPVALMGRYGGSYTCTDGEHGFYLDLTRLTPAADGQGYAAAGVIGFFPILSGLDDRGTGPAGSFLASGSLAPDGALSMTRDEDGWLFHALGYGSPELRAMLGARVQGGFEIRGRILLSSDPEACGTMIATKFQPPPPPVAPASPGER